MASSATHGEDRHREFDEQRRTEERAQPPADDAETACQRGDDGIARVAESGVRGT